jgi:hypothetical protein
MADVNHRSRTAEQVKTYLDIAQSLVTILAVLAGGIWFTLQRSTKPEIKLEHSVSQRPVAGSPNMWLISVEVRATNVGKVKVELEAGVMEISQVNPVPGDDLLSAQLRDMRLEPGESDQAIFRTYQIPDSIRTIQIHSRYQVPGTSHMFWDSRPLYWNLLTLADIGETAGQTSPLGKR